MSNGSRPEPIESLLLDLHLGQLGPEQRLRVEEAVAGSPELAAQSRAIREVITLLEQDDVPPPPPDLAERVLQRIDEQTATLPFAEAASALPAGTAHDLSAIPVLSLRELIAIAACITLFVGVFVPGYFKAQNISRRNACRWNLTQLGQAMTAYALSNDRYVAYAGYVPGGSWLPTRTPNVRRVSNTRPLFLLLKGGYIPGNDPRVFICPAMPEARPMLADDYSLFTDFAEPANIPYSFQSSNLPQGRTIDKMHPRMVLIGDRNPLFDQRAAHRLSPYAEDGNSLAHGEGSGQNVLYVNGSAGWCTQPTVGVDRDNIYRAGGLGHYQGTELPVSDTDTQLVP